MECVFCILSESFQFIVNALMADVLHRGGFIHKKLAASGYKVSFPKFSFCVQQKHLRHSSFIVPRSTFSCKLYCYPKHRVAFEKCIVQVEILHCKSHMQRLDGIVLYVPAVVYSEKLFCIHDARSFYMKITSVDGENVLCRIHFMLASSCV